jgi:hypothetical protein
MLVSVNEQAYGFGSSGLAQIAQSDSDAPARMAVAVVESSSDLRVEP